MSPQSAPRLTAVDHIALNILQGICILSPARYITGSLRGIITKKEVHDLIMHQERMPDDE